MRLLVYAPQDTFIRPITDELSKRHEVKLAKEPPTKQMLWRDLAWADVVWVEWCGPHLVDICNAPFNKPIICRLHSYEVFTEIPSKVKWHKVACLVFVAEHIREIFSRQFPDVQPPIRVIENGVDLNKFRFEVDKPRTKKIASIGFINYKKNPGLLLQCFKSLHDADPGYELHIAGTHQDPRIQIYMDAFIEEAELPVVYHGWVHDVAAWLRDKEYVISTSYLESFQYGIAEAMACGVIPFVHAWPGASDLYPRDSLFLTVEEFVTGVKRLAQQMFPARDRIRTDARKWIVSNYSLDERIAEIENLLDWVQDRTRGDGQITLTMIVKDEAKGIGKALDSARGLVDARLVFVDNETADDTAQIARDRGARVHIYEWEDDFAASRNKCQNEAATEWVLVLDGHEYVEGDFDVVHEVMKEHPQADAFNVRVRMESGQEHRHPRLYKRSRAQWINPIHNVLNVEGVIVDMDELVIVHDRHHGQTREARERRNEQREETVIRILSKRILENSQDTRSMFYLAQQHKDALRWEAALYWYERYVKTHGGQQWDEEGYTALYQGARAALVLKDFERARDFGHTATTIYMERAEAWDVIGEVFFVQGNFQQALTAFVTASRCPVPGTARLWFDRDVCEGGWLIHCKIASCYARMGRDQEAADVWRKALATKSIPPSEVARVMDNLSRHLVALGQDEFDAADYWRARYRAGGDSGAGSSGQLLQYKADFVNKFVDANAVKAVLDHGCGDGRLASKLDMVEQYIGYDVAHTALEQFAKNCPKGAGPQRVDAVILKDGMELMAQLGLSLDVIFHLTDDVEYHRHMERLFDWATKYVIIYAPDKEDDGSNPVHIKYRKFTRWIEDNRAEWTLILHETNKYPYDPAQPEDTSLSDFYVYSKRLPGPSPDEN